MASKFQYKGADVAQKLDILATHEPIILKNIDSKGHGEYMIPIKSVIQQLRKEFILSVALEALQLDRIPSLKPIIIIIGRINSRIIQ